ncbi:Valyl-tRNA synthetase [Escherichia coli]|uniref:Valyl-tRNA synthetase n=1 Tax=Escherichia coli TaxID=562 RepID=A0A376UC25_ECOLX|nr:Valyl-tRNA synthetase [Escherichia coli]
MITITKGRLLTIKQWRETYGPGSNVVLQQKKRKNWHELLWQRWKPSR